GRFRPADRGRSDAEGRRDDRPGPGRAAGDSAEPRLHGELPARGASIGADRSALGVSGSAEQPGSAGEREWHRILDEVGRGGARLSGLVLTRNRRVLVSVGGRGTTL